MQMKAQVLPPSLPPPRVSFKVSHTGTDSTSVCLCVLVHTLRTDKVSSFPLSQLFDGM